MDILTNYGQCSLSGYRNADTADYLKNIVKDIIKSVKDIPSRVAVLENGIVFELSLDDDDDGMVPITNEGNAVLPKFKTKDDLFLIKRLAGMDELHDNGVPKGTELTSIKDESQDGSLSQDVVPGSLKVFESRLEELLTLLSHVLYTGSEEEQQKKKQQLEKCHMVMVKQEETIRLLEVEYGQKVTESESQVSEKRSEIECLERNLKQLLRITTEHTETIIKETTDKNREFEMECKVHLEELEKTVALVELELHDIQKDNTVKEDALRQRRCLTQNALDEKAAEHEREIFLKKNLLNTVDYEYRKQTRILQDLESKIQEVEQELGEIKLQRQQEIEKKQDRRRKLKDVFRTWIRLRFAFQNHKNVEGLNIMKAIDKETAEP